MNSLLTQSQFLKEEAALFNRLIEDEFKRFDEYFIPIDDVLEIVHVYEIFATKELIIDFLDMLDEVDLIPCVHWKPRQKGEYGNKYWYFMNFDVPNSELINTNSDE